MVRLNIEDQIIALQNMWKKIFRFLVPKETKIKVPPIGVRKSGVAKAIPISPYFLQSVTMDLELLLKTLRFRLKRSAKVFLIFCPTKVNKNTLDIIPETVTSIVSQNP